MNWIKTCPRPVLLRNCLASRVRHRFNRKICSLKTLRVLSPFVNWSFRQFAISSTWNSGCWPFYQFGSLSFCQLAILSTSQFANKPFTNLPFCQLPILSTSGFVTLSTCHFINMAFCQLDISGTCHFVSFPFHQLGILSVSHFINLGFCHFTNSQFHQFEIMSAWHFIILTTCYFINLTFYHFFNLPLHNWPFCHFVNLAFC